MIIKILTDLSNDIFKAGKLPGQFKIGAVVPCHKKKKPISNPDSYRRITIASNIGKVVEKAMLTRTKNCIKGKEDPLQYGFTENCSTSICALLVTEAIAEAKDMGTSLHLSFMDSSKAFDMVDHTVLLNELHDIGITSSLWNMYSDMYAQVTSRIRLNGELSRIIQEERGIRQGAETSPTAFKIKDTKFLSSVRNNPASFRIGSTSVGIPTVADDNCLITGNSKDAQTQLFLAGDNAASNRYMYNINKSKAMATGKLNGNEEHPILMLNDTQMEHSKEEVHLGLTRTANGTASAAVAARLQIGRRAAYSLMGAGLHGVNGISPDISKSLVLTYVEPAILYGLEAMVLQEKDYEELDKSHRILLRQIQSLPDSTAMSAVYLLIGCIPLRAKVHQRMLTLLNTILNRTGSVEFDIIERQLAMKHLKSKSWTAQLRLILHQYSLPSPLELLDNTPTKVMWKRQVKNAIQNYWYRKLKEDAASKKTLIYLNCDSCCIGSSHPVWRCGSDPLQVRMAGIKARLLVGRYPLTATKYAGNKLQQKCPLCMEAPETMAHFILECSKLESYRQPLMTKIQPWLHNIQDREEMVKFILDPSHFSSDVEEIYYLEGTTRRLCYSLHKHRSQILKEGGG